MKTSLKLNENYYLNSEKVNSETTVEVAKKTNHIFVVDVSGSMYSELPLIRKQLKNKLSNLMKDGDTISIVWFSGNNQAGILKEEVEVKSLQTLTDLHDAIDRWLRPIGLTAFLKPLELVKDLVGRIQSNRPESVFSMIFLTDGYNNDCPWNEVISTLKSLENDIVASTFVEYGYYADTQKLTQMAAVLGGEKVSCDGFDNFEPIFESKISSDIMGGKKIVVQLSDAQYNPYDFAFSVGADGSILLYNVNESGEVLVGSSVKNVYYFGTSGTGVENAQDDAVLYAAIYVLSDKLLNEDAEKVFYTLGDQHYYKMLANSFGKQKLNSFKTAIKDCVADATKRFPDGGRVHIKPIDDNAYCLMNLIEDLGNIENCLFYPSHEDFKYNRIGRKKIAVGSKLTDADKKRLAEAKNIEEISKITSELAENKVDIKFEKAFPEKGYPLTDLVWNESRANLGVRIYIEGEAILPENKFGIDKVSSFKYNTFTLIKDGIVNVEKLPVNWSQELDDLLMKNEVAFSRSTVHDSSTGDTDRYIIIDLTSLPLINRKMVKSVSAVELAKLQWELKKLQGDKKVYDFYKKELYPKTSKSYAELLGDEAAAWLKEIGITDFNGFAPKVESAEATDFYMSVVLDTKIKGLSSLPKVDVVKKKIEDGVKLKINEYVMADALKKYMAQLASDMYTSLSEEQQKGVLKTYLETKSKILNKQRRKVLQEIAQIKFSLILSKKWFNEFKTFDENQLSINLDGKDLDFTFVLEEKEEKI